MRPTWTRLLAEVEALARAAADRGDMAVRTHVLETAYAQAVRDRYALAASGRFATVARMRIADNELIELARGLGPDHLAILRTLPWLHAESVGAVADAYLRDKVGQWNLSHVARTVVGSKRSLNEDAFFARPDVRAYGVVDGMGGHASGEAGAAVTIEALVDQIGTSGQSDLVNCDDVIKAGFAFASERLGLLAEQSNNDYLAAVALLWIVGETAVIGHIGDCRAYRLRDGELEQLTQDHRLFDELVRLEQLDPEQIASFPHHTVLTRAIMPRRESAPSLSRFPIETGDVFLLTTDGLTDAMEAGELSSRVAGAAEDELPQLVGELLDDERVRENATAMFVVCR